MQRVVIIHAIIITVLALQYLEITCCRTVLKYEWIIIEIQCTHIIVRVAVLIVWIGICRVQRVVLVV